MENTDDDFEEPLSDDPEENLRLENELLHLKLKAELGAETQNFADIPPEVENEFLKNILAFEHAHENAEQIKIYDLLGRPAFVPSIELDDDAIKTELGKLTELLAEKNIEIDFIAQYPDRVKYSFITEELFERETDDFVLPGMVMHYIYEEFHPNNQMDIENRAKRFIESWFEKNFSEYSSEIDSAIALPGGKTLTKAALLEKLQHFFDCYSDFSDCEYVLEDTAFEIDAEGRGLGHAEGVVKYTATLESNETVTFNGPFKLYLSREYDWWSIFYFVFPGWAF